MTFWVVTMAAAIGIWFVWVKVRRQRKSTI
jgi:hypothetical protein